MIATRAPDLGWSAEAKQMIASWVEQLGWRNPADAENAANRPTVPQNAQAAAVAQTASDKLATTGSIDPQQLHQIALDLAAVRQIVEQVAASQTKMAGEIENLLVTDMEMFLKIPSSSPALAASRKSNLVVPASPASSRKSPPAAPSSRAPDRHTDLMPNQSLADSFRN
jgi:hypothetical protein